jgi:hypothetical protein
MVAFQVGLNLLHNLLLHQLIELSFFFSRVFLLCIVLSSLKMIDSH